MSKIESDTNSNPDLQEKGVPSGLHIERTDADIEHNNGEVLLRVEHGVLGLKLAADGHTVLVPQPSDAPEDPLNWSALRKYTMLFMLAFSAASADFQAGAGIPAFGPQTVEWGVTFQEIVNTSNINVLMLGLGGVVWVPLAYCWGRLPVLFYCRLFGSLALLGCALASSYEIYYAMRALSSFFLVDAQINGLLFIRDMYCVHERARAIGLWIVIFLISPYCGPIFGGFMVDRLQGDWRSVMWLAFAFNTLVLAVVIVAGEETWYVRDQPMPARKGGLVGRVKDLTGVTAFQERHLKPGFVVSALRLLEVFIKPVTILVILYNGMSFMWAVGLNITSSIFFGTPRAQGGYGFSPTTTSFVYFTPVVGLILGEAIAHWANDAVANRYVKRNNGIFRPEARLPIIYPCIAIMVPGLVIFGFSCARQWNIAAVILGWGLYIVGLMVSAVAITAYMVDAFPSASAEVACVGNLSRSLTGFSVGYFQQDMATRLGGFDKSFALQSGIVAASAIVVVILHVYGAKIRKAGGPLHYSPKE